MAMTGNHHFESIYFKATYDMSPKHGPESLQPA